MKIAAVIPSRFQSTRFPGKPLAQIAGKTMIERVYRQVEKANCFSEIIVATDDQRILDEVIAFGGIARMTDEKINSGSERVWAVLAQSDCDAAVNIQGDEPLISEKLIFQIYDALSKKTLPVVSAARFNISYQDFLSKNIVKVVLAADHQAIYFSRSPVPYCEKDLFKGFFQHIGIYGYTREALKAYMEGEISPLEKTEKLEQLRFLHLGLNITIVLTEYESHGVDVPADIDKVTAILRRGHV
ncbi:MAG: 3-deoxy-manno-octulosonate cytidylyltransferase [Candidatus Aminicenantes bacterium]|nr:3-deoxy-manno-octulosonate cytidylyltransferase [Candidatus Aminicenantes bacterium]